MSKVSILLPTRKRFGMFKSSVDSLFENCENESNFEVLVGLDLDDPEIEIVKEYTVNKKNIKLFFYERFFYRGLNKYYNDLSSNATGTSLLLWNDDAIMKSKNWDTEILKNHKKFCVLNPKVDTMEDYWENRGVLFPIIPKKWVEITGMWSPHPSCDSWIDFLSKRLNLLIKLDSVTISHNRCDIVGGVPDGTYNESRGDMSNASFNVSYPEIVEEHFQKISNYLIQDTQ